ncbi:hypothetical protein EV128_104295 [Rhizobium azibense]|nr:hypothetical protein EV128_104295 [Rhizobium azibense]
MTALASVQTPYSFSSPSGVNFYGSCFISMCKRQAGFAYSATALTAEQSKPWLRN